MAARFVYVYRMSGDVAKVRAAAPAHGSYWKDAGLPGYMGGPFADRSGGLITFEAGSLDEVNARVREDPFVRQGLVADQWVKEWQPE